MTVDERIQALLDLIELREPIPAAIKHLRRFPWDSDAGLVALTGNDLIRILDAYLAGEVSDTGVEAWAEALEGRDDIVYEPKQAYILKQIVFELANPLLTTSMSPARASRLTESLSELGLP
jgi:hypothetical protein